MKRKIISLVLAVLLVLGLGGCEYQVLSNEDLETKISDAVTAARRDAYAQGLEDGLDTKPEQEELDAAYQEGYDAGKSAGYDAGKEDGYTEGLADGKAQAEASTPAPSSGDSSGTSGGSSGSSGSSSSSSGSGGSSGSSGSESSSQTVYKTRTGSKYHRSSCRYLSQSCYETTVADAKAAGLTPCSVCNPPQ